MEQSSSERSFWPFFAAATVVVIILAAVRWSLAHPYGVHWDEAEYLNNVWIDLQRLYRGEILKLGGRILIKSYGMPPAYRLLALPFLALSGFHVTMARLISLSGFGLSSWFIYLATRRVGSQVAGAFAVLIFSLSPEVVSASMFFGTDPPLYLAISAMLYYLFVHWSDPSERPGTWIGLGVAIGLGFWAKASFAAIALPALAFGLVVDYRRDRTIQSLVPITKAGVLGALLAAPWWLVNARYAAAYARYSRDFVRTSLGPPSVITSMRWFSTVLQGLLGVSVSILIGIVLAIFLMRATSSRAVPNSLQKTTLGVCACAGLPILLAQLSGTNHLLRHITAAVIPLAIAVGVLTDCAELIHSRTIMAACGILFCSQLLMIVAPVFYPNHSVVNRGLANGSLPWQVMVRFDQWDWGPIRDISNGCGLETPKISYLGNGREFNPPQIERPWVPWAAKTTSYPDVSWLWRYEDGLLDWQKVMDSAEKSDLVLTAPHFIGGVPYKEDMDNQHNAEFSKRLANDPLFRGPIHLTTGRFEPIDIVVFVKKTLVCQ